jgi:hypothetical protein
MVDFQTDAWYKQLLLCEIRNILLTLKISTKTSRISGVRSLLKFSLTLCFKYVKMPENRVTIGECKCMCGINQITLW